MKKIFIGNSDAWMRLAFGVLLLLLATQMAKHSPANLNSPKPGVVMEW